MVRARYFWYAHIQHNGQHLSREVIGSDKDDILQVERWMHNHYPHAINILVQPTADTYDTDDLDWYVPNGY